MAAVADAAFRGTCLSDERGELCTACYETALEAMPDDGESIDWPEPLAGADAFDPVSCLTCGGDGEVERDAPGSLYGVVVLPCPTCSGASGDPQ